MKKIIENAKVVLENGIIWDGAIVIEDGKIVDVGNSYDIKVPADAEHIDAGGAYVGPGFVDIHVHGGDGSSFFDEPEKVAKHFLKHGETTILPTSSYGMEYDDMMDGIRRVKDAMKTTKSIKGIYMESPYMSNKYGASNGIDNWNVNDIKPEDYIPMVDELGSVVKVWVIAPEREGIKPFVEYAKKVNPDVVIAVGHSEATPDQIKSLGGKLRPTLSTHLFNATGRQTGHGGIRGYGPDEYCLANNEMYAELISDSLGVHVHSDLQRMAVEAKGVYRIVLITDCTSETGAVPERFSHLRYIDVSFNDLGRLSGSKVTMNVACRNIMSHTRCGITEAFIMGSLNPARVIGMDDKIGSIESGKVADLVFVDDKFNVQKVMQEGELCKF